MNKNLEIVSLGLFVFVIVCFALPFTIFGNCSGFYLAMGAFGDSPDPFAIAALVAAAAGGALFFWKDRAAVILQAVVGALGAIVLITMKVIYDQQSGGPGWAFGYFLTILGFAAIIAVNLYRISVRTGQPVATPAYNGGSTLRCPSCNSENNPGNNWCEVCGSALRGSSNAFSYNTPPVPASAAVTAPVRAVVTAAMPEESRTQPLSTPSKVEAAGGSTMPLAADHLPQPAPGQLAFLRVQRVGRWELIPVLKNVFVIGSAQGSTDYQEHSGNLGHIHARIEKAAGGFGITKLGTDNVVYVNDQSLTDSSPHPLRAGDLIRLNNIEYIFDLA